MSSVYGPSAACFEGPDSSTSPCQNSITDNSDDGVLMDDSVYPQMVPQIRRAQKERLEVWLAWIPLITALTALIGTLVALVALLKK